MAPSPTRNQIETGQRIRAIRLKRKLRQTDLAATAGMSWRHLIRIERGEGGEPKRETLDRLAEALGVDRSELTGDEDEEEAQVPLTRHEFELLGDLMSRLGRNFTEAKA